MSLIAKYRKRQARHARLRTTEGKEISTKNQELINNAHDGIKNGMIAMGKNPPPAAMQYLSDAHDNLKDAGADCDCPADDNERTDPTNLAAHYTPPDPYAAGLAKLRSERGIVDLEITPDLDPNYDTKRGVAPNGYDIHRAIRQLGAAKPEPVVLSASERESLGGFADDVQRLRNRAR